MNVSSVASVTSRIQPQQVSASVVKAADGDGDGRSGTAALNDGDAAAQAAARQAHSSSHTVDVRA